MLTKDTVFNVSREGYRLLENKDANNGRAMRRFLSREVNNGLVLQVFMEYGTQATPLELCQCAEIAEGIRRQSLHFLPCSFAQDARTNVDAMFSIVQNSYVLAIDVQTASVACLREAVKVIVTLSDSMHGFVPYKFCDSSIDTVVSSFEILEA